ncbi:hypothetical protein CRUP_022618 [Coryphaenoides rupestris]|nr:hypothetical protein CRUP_022618 [Coryphaenoides rupestris]
MTPTRRVNTNSWCKTIFAPPNVTDMDSLWKDAKPDDLMDSKLRCVFELPSENDKVSRTDTFSGGAGAQLATANDVEATKATPVLNSAKSDGLLTSVAAAKPSSSSSGGGGGGIVDDSEMKRVLDECKRLQTEMGKMAEENMKLKDDGIRMRKAVRSDHMTSNSPALLGRESSTSSLPSLLVVIAAIFIGFFLGKFIL